MRTQNVITVGRRKASVARVVLSPGSGSLTINDRPLDTYFPTAVLRNDVLKPFAVTNMAEHMTLR